LRGIKLKRRRGIWGKQGKRGGGNQAILPILFHLKV